MQLARILIALTVLSLGTACASRSRPVALQAGPATRKALLGAWRGSYSIDRRRGGVISFSLLPGDDEAHGDVLMIANGTLQPYARATPDGLPPQGGPVVRTELLSISFVQADDSRVSGTLTPYWDPERSCTAQATFAGTINRGSISGTFVSTCDRGVPTYTGRWTMHRRR